MLQERHFIKRLAKRLINCENRNINRILFVCACLQKKQARKFIYFISDQTGIGSKSTLLFQILTMGFKNFILSLLILARMSQVSKFERVLSPINVTSNLHLEFNFSISGPGLGGEQAGQWLDVQFS